MIIGEKIGEGSHRECFAIQGTKRCVKILKKKDLGPFLGLLNTFLGTIFLKFHLTNLNQKEQSIFSNLPVAFKEYLPTDIRVISDMLTLNRPLDFDGSYSKTAKETGPIRNTSFWKHVDLIYRMSQNEGIFLIDAFRLGDNVVVQKISPEEWKPILIDVKRVGYKGYPFQLHLLLKSQQEKMFLRRLLRFERSFKPSTFN